MMIGNIGLGFTHTYPNMSKLCIVFSTVYWAWVLCIYASTDM